MSKANFAPPSPCCKLGGGGGGGFSLICMGYIGMRDPTGYGFSVVLVINRVTIWPFWSNIGYSFTTLVLNW